MKVFLFSLLLIATWCLATLHVGAVAPPRDPRATPAMGTLFPKAPYGMHNLFLAGSPYGRGLEFGKLTQDLVRREEFELNERLAHAVPSRWLRGLLFLGLMRWYHDVENSIEPWMKEEMWGVSQATTHELDGIADRFTRQLAYHGLHEVGQMFIDSGVAMGCTVFAVPNQGSWIIGRNFDFEGGRIFDEEKVVKWVFPEDGNAFVSVIWAGMVGAVTGVNDKGVFLSLNAAGSSDRRHLGVPSTLVLMKALLRANNAEDAVKVIETEDMFITDIFLVADRTSAYRVEKSPRRTRVARLSEPSVIANHLTHPDWRGDEVNDFRARALTSHFRQARGEALLKTLRPGRVVDQVLGFLRDRKGPDGERLTLGHRKAIDALIATHSVVYDAAAGTLYVSQGPAVAGPFTGYDLAHSFRERRPVVAGFLPRDPEISDETFRQVSTGMRWLQEAEKLAKAKDCVGASERIEKARPFVGDDYRFHLASGLFEKCRGNREAAIAAWRSALSGQPAYESERNFLMKAVQE